MLRRLLCLAVLAIAGLASTAAAESAMTMRLGTPDLQAGVLIVVPVSVSCSPFDPSLTLFSENVGVSVEQAVGKRIAFGSASIMRFLPQQPLLFLCDDTEHTFVVNVLANTAGPPFKRGLAVFSGFAVATAGVSCGPGCFFNIVSQQGSFGPTPIRIR